MANKVTIEFTRGEFEVVRAAASALLNARNPYEAMQRAQEKNHDVMPVAEGSEEAQAIWIEICNALYKVTNADQR